MSGGGTVVAVCGEFLSPLVRDCSGQCDQGDQCPVLGRRQITGANNYHSLQPTARRDILHLQSYSAT